MNFLQQNKYLIGGVLAPIIATLISEREVLVKYSQIVNNQMDPWIVLIPALGFWLVASLLITNFLRHKHYQAKNFLGIFAMMVIVSSVSLALTWKEALIWIVER